MEKLYQLVKSTAAASVTVHDGIVVRTSRPVRHLLGMTERGMIDWAKKNGWTVTLAVGGNR